MAKSRPPSILLTWLGARTRRLRLGTAVIVLPWHNAGASGGAGRDPRSPIRRAGSIFGIGKGYRYNEFAGFCVPMEEADARFDECLDVILKAWTADEPFSHQGKYWRFDSIVVEPPPAQRPHPQIWMGAGSERSIRRVAAQGSTCLLGQYASLRDVAWNIAVYKSEVEAHGRCFDPMQVGVTRAFFDCPTIWPRERRRWTAACKNRMRQLKLATRPDGTVHGGPDRATGDPRAVNEASAMYGNPDDIARKLEELREAGVGYVLLNGGGSGGGGRGRESLRRFAREVMPVLRRADEHRLNPIKIEVYCVRQHGVAQAVAASP